MVESSATVQLKIVRTDDPAQGTSLASKTVMTVLEFVVYLVIAGICGAIARAIAGGTPGGFIVSVLLGFLGAFVGAWIARQFLPCRSSS